VVFVWGGFGVVVVGLGFWCFGGFVLGCWLLLGGVLFFFLGVGCWVLDIT